jgi:hypothetical protein
MLYWLLLHRLCLLRRIHCIILYLLRYVYTNNSMAINILKTRTLDSAKTIVEMSFGNYLQLKKLSPAQSAATDAQIRLDSIREKLEGISLAEAKVLCITCYIYLYTYVCILCTSYLNEMNAV